MRIQKLRPGTVQEPKGIERPSLEIDTKQGQWSVANAEFVKHMYL
jgi:hypothetical protein